MRITLQAFSSSGGSYPVEFSDDTGVMRVFCHCQAGITQQMCKHKVGLIRGDAKMLYKPSDEPLLKQIMALPAYPALKARLEEYEAQLLEIERELAGVKEREKTLKAEFAYLLTHGQVDHDIIAKRNYHAQRKSRPSL